jgi:hypothetical protein
VVVSCSPSTAICQIDPVLFFIGSKEISRKGADSAYEKRQSITSVACSENIEKFT